MVESDIKIYKLNYSGTFEEKKTDNILDLFTLYTILSIYSKRAKRMYIWVSANATQSLRIYIPQIRELFAQEYPDLRILRNITIDSGEETFDFFKLFSFSKQELSDHINSQEKVLEPIRNEIIALKEEIDAHIEKENYDEACTSAEKIILLAESINDNALKRDQQELMQSLKDKNKIKDTVQIIKKDAEEIKKKFEAFVNEEKFMEAHELVQDFKKAIVKIDVNFLNIPFITELFQKEGNIWQSAKLDEEIKIKSIERLEKNYQGCIHDNDINKAEKIIQKAQDLLKLIFDKKIKEKWDKIEESFSKQKSENEEEQTRVTEEIKELEIKINVAKNHNNLNEIITTCEKVINLAKINARSELVSQFTDIKENAKKELKETNEIVNILIEEIAKLKGEKNFSKGISKIDSMQQDLEGPDFNEQRTLLEKLKTELKLEEEKQLEIENEAKSLEEKFNDTQNKENLTESIKICEEIIQFSKTNNFDDLKKKYTPLLKNLKQDLVDKKKKYDKSLNDILKLKDENKPIDAVEKIDLLMEEITGADFLDQRTELKDIKLKIASEKENKIKFNAEIGVLEEKLTTNQNLNDFTEAIIICQKMIKLSEENGSSELVNKYTEIFEQIKQDKEDTKEIVETLINEIIKLKDVGKFKEAIIKINSMMEDVDGKDFKEEKAKLKGLKEEIQNEDDKNKKVSENIKQLEDNIAQNQKIHNINDAIIACEKIIHLSKENGRNDILKEYTEKKVELKKKLEENIRIINSMIENIEKLKSEAKFDEAFNMIDSVKEKFQGPDFKDYEVKVNTLKEEIFREKEEYSKATQKIDGLVNIIENHREKKNFDLALSNCIEVIKIAERTGIQDKIKEYEMLLKTLEKEIEEFKKEANLKAFEGLKDNINALCKEGVEILNKSMLKDSLDIFENIITQLEEYKANM